MAQLNRWSNSSKNSGELLSGRIGTLCMPFLRRSKFGPPKNRMKTSVPFTVWRTLVTCFTQAPNSMIKYQYVSRSHLGKFHLSFTTFFGSFILQVHNYWIFLWTPLQPLHMLLIWKIVATEIKVTVVKVVLNACWFDVHEYLKVSGILRCNELSSYRCWEVSCKALPKR